MQEGKTVRVKRPGPQSSAVCPPGLLLFHPLGSTPRYPYFPLAEGTTVIGRAADSDIVVDHDGVSRRHAELTVVQGQAKLTDTDSSNGVIINGTRVSSAALRGGEVIRLGDAFLRLLSPGLAPSSAWFDLHTRGMISGPSLDPVRVLLSRVADDELTVLILGETGTGKEIAASFLHQASSRRDGPLVAVNCAALPATMVESELFGHVKGSFTGATTDSPGLIRQAAGGIVFLDEVGELPIPAQAKLLRVLQDHQVRPVGGTRPVAVDVRVVCATNRDLGASVRDGSFRPDLYARIAELVVQLPPLRDRIEDLPLLVGHFVEKHARRRCAISAAAIELLCTRPWPLNVRGLETAVRRALLHAGSASLLEPEHFPEDPVADRPFATAAPVSEGGASYPPPRSESVRPNDPQQAEADPRARRLQEALQRNAGDATAAALELGISRSQLYRRAKKAGIDVGRYKP